MARFVLSLHSAFDDKSAIGVFDSEQGLQYLQIEDLSRSLSQPQLRGLCCAEGRLYVTTPSSLRIYAIAPNTRPGQAWFRLEREVVLPEWVLDKRPDAGLQAVHYAAHRGRLLVACNALASIDEFDLAGDFLGRRHLWQIAPQHFQVPAQATGREGFGHIRGICENSAGELFLTVAFRNWSETGSVIGYDSGELLLDKLETPHSGLFLEERYFVLNVQGGSLLGLPLVMDGEALQIKASIQSIASRGLKINLRGLSGDSDGLYAGLFNFDKDEKKKVASQLVRFDPLSGQQDRLYLLPEIAGFRYPAPFYLSPFAGVDCHVAEDALVLVDATELQTCPVVPVEEQRVVAAESSVMTAPVVSEQKPAPVRKTPPLGRPVIDVVEASLSYRRGVRLHTWLRKRQDRDFRALKGVSLTLREGEVLGLVGRNGSGKSTMGMLLAGILQPDQGSIERHGRIQLLSLGIGFNNELSGRDNVFVNAALLGLSRREVLQHLDEIIKFSEIGEFIDEPIRTYSAGMRSRLAFAIATVIQPDVLILDEVLSTGDDSFRRKAEARMREMKGKAKCVVMVSHSANQIKKLCTRVVWLERGHLVLDGRPKQVMPEYEAFCQSPEKWLRRHPNIAARLQE
ncbi:ABC transporter ATP-binding protein [Aquipseudomonas campi]|uniref:ABC transporter ATP-binding protein n=1 Tax=Aquipseudomonas campi TaxID=2731681 RepID=A0A6M8FLE5_9GAMM|nr:ABC transporter ATP-binding protein [Pseudomonas campi]QKE65457.1 ABC transporter ATP-binding protein [Pseudomonas campi]